MAFTVTPLTLFLCIPAFDTGLKISEIVPFVLATFAAVVSICVGVLTPSISSDLSISLSLSFFLSVLFALSPSTTFTVIVPTSLILTLLSARKFPVVRQLGIILVLSCGLLSLVDAYAVFHEHTTGIFLRSLSRTLTPTRMNPIPPPSHPIICWLISYALTLLITVYNAGGFSSYFTVPKSTSAIPPPPSKPSLPSRIPSHIGSTPGLASHNFFDPSDLPPKLAEYASVVYSACEDIGNFFGFQDR